MVVIACNVKKFKVRDDVHRFVDVFKMVANIFLRNVSEARIDKDLDLRGVFSDNGSTFVNMLTTQYSTTSLV